MQGLQTRCGLGHRFVVGLDFNVSHVEPSQPSIGVNIDRHPLLLSTTNHHKIGINHHQSNHFWPCLATVNHEEPSVTVLHHYGPLPNESSSTIGWWLASPAIPEEVMWVATRQGPVFFWRFCIATTPKPMWSAREISGTPGWLPTSWEWFEPWTFTGWWCQMLFVFNQLMFIHYLQLSINHSPLPVFNQTRGTMASCWRAYDFGMGQLQ